MTPSIAKVPFQKLETLWFHTGSRCNLSCSNCYIESNPKNDRIKYLAIESLSPFLDEAHHQGTKLIGFTGGEPFLNPQIIDLICEVLSRDFDLLILTNGHHVLKRHRESLLKIKRDYPKKLFLRISLDHHTEPEHDKVRGTGTFDSTLKEIKWLHQSGFQISLASRSSSTIKDFQALLYEREIDWNLEKDKIVFFPEMDKGVKSPTITDGCWSKLKKSPLNLMCSTERMIVHHKDHLRPKVMPCTLLAYEERHMISENIQESLSEIYLDHPFCAQFCVLGGASCSAQK